MATTIFKTEWKRMLTNESSKFTTEGSSGFTSKGSNEVETSVSGKKMNKMENFSTLPNSKGHLIV